MSPGKSFFDGEFRLPAVEEKVLDFWKTNQIFEKSLALRKNKKRFVFFEGPPTANGKPGIHHVLARAFKDLIPRYKTMQGFQVPRKGGWDTHGLPVELEVEKQLGLKSKKDIEKFGIAAFNKKCKESVWKYKDEWERLTERMGYWLDLKHPYITYENDYIETLWWIIKEIAKKKLLYQGHKVVPWCTRCGTALSSHELAQGYDTVTDQSVYVKFKAKPGAKFTKTKANNNFSILAWTTTPWTLPGNVALAVGERVAYVIVKHDGEYFLLAEDTLAKILPNAEVVQRLQGKDLEGMEYEPLFKISSLQDGKTHRVYLADFVTTDEGTGVVHTAVMYGEDDYALGTKVGLPQHHTVDETGKFADEVQGLAGLYVRDKKTDEKIFEYLKRKGLLLKIESHAHEYPHCWRCGTALIYYARTSWFVKVSALRAKLVANNKKVNWIPSHVKEGRFGGWLREGKDWNFSRERYWGTPLPVWRCAKCGHDEIAGSCEELRAKAIRRNTFLFMRHGQATTNVQDIEPPPKDTPRYTSKLTGHGKQQIEEIALGLKGEGVNLIIASPRVRTRETAEIVSKATGAPVTYDESLCDIDPGELALKPAKEWDKFFDYDEMRMFASAPPGGESRNQAKMRMAAFLKKADAAHAGKTILIVSHGDPLWLLNGALNGLSDEALLKLPYPKVGELYEIDHRPLPLDEDFRADFHRPYIDEIKLECSQCGGTAARMKEVVDVWFDSGAMPFAQWHWPFARIAKREAQNVSERSATRYTLHGVPFPADYISEAVDQTRGWFYTLLAVATLLGKGAPYKNVISLGHINDKFGRKMSKSKGNIVDPWLMIQKYGIDAVRWYLYAATPPGEPKNFDEADIAKSFRKLHLLLYNSLVFYRTYAKQGAPRAPKPAHVLDRWILARLDETIRAATKHLDRYEVREASLSLENLVDDLSRWYIRRSRRRLQPARRGLDVGGKPGDKKDFEAASGTLGTVLRETAKLLAPFTPFFAEALYGATGGEGSVHLVSWPKAGGRSSDRKLLSSMAEVRRIASLVLAKREESKVKVRQPLGELHLKSGTLKDKKLLGILADEVNVKKVSVRGKLDGDFALDTAITPELREEGILRELVRTVQDLRQKAGLKPRDKILLMLEIGEPVRGIAARNEAFLKREVGAQKIEYKKSEKFVAEIETKIEDWSVWIGIRKV